MRVIAGSAKGRRLVGPDTRNTRPLMDRAREALFSALGSQVIDAEVLDLFAGSGSIGIEALSRGARRVIFVEKGRAALAALQQNLATVGFDGAVVVSQPVEGFLASVTGAFDLVFCDPPWAMSTDEVERLMVSAGSIVAEGGEFIVHRHQADRQPETAGWRLATARRYGDGKIYRYVKEPI